MGTKRKEQELRITIWLDTMAKHIAGNTTRLILITTIGLTLVGLLPATAQASTNPVDLELGGEGSTPWVISNIKPGDSGTKVVELRNIGSEDGFVTIWLDDIISSEGINPESETGDTTEPGEIDHHLQLNLTVDGLSTNLDLPATIIDFPHSASWSNYLEVIPLKAGDTINLQWDWELPPQTGNVVQGDAVSFTTNYLLRQYEATDVSVVVTDEGIFTEEVIIKSEAGNGELNLEENTVGKSKEEEPLTEIWFIEIMKESSAPNNDTAIIGAHYEAGPDGTNFNTPVTITLHFDPNDFPDRTILSSMTVAVWDEATGEWVELGGSTIDWVNHTISAPITHFSRYTILTHIDSSPPPPSPGPYLPEPSIPVTPEPDEEDIIEEEEDITETAVLETNTLVGKDKVEIEADGTLLEPMTIMDRSGTFIINIDTGARITNSDNQALSRIELTITEESLVRTADLVVLSPTFKLTGYIGGMEVSRIDFDPFASITIKYDSKDLPEDTFPPYLAGYTREQGLVQLEPIPGSTFEIGKVEARISHASLFVVVAELAPPPLPLPAKFEVSNLTIEPGEARLGQLVIISFEIANEGETTGSHELQLRIDGIVRLVREVTVPAGSSQILTFEVPDLSVGKHQVRVASLSGQVRVVDIVVTLGESTVNWLILDLSIGAGVVIVLLTLYLIKRKSQQSILRNRRN
jgi:hypothetical protein